MLNVWCQFCKRHGNGHIIKRLFVYFLINEQLFAPKYISQRLKRGQKECEKVSSKTTEKRRTGTRRFGALRLSAAQLSDAHSLIPLPPLTTSLLRHTHTVHVPPAPRHPPQQPSRAGRRLRNAPQRCLGPQVLYSPNYICLELVLLSSVFWVML